MRVHHRCLSEIQMDGSRMLRCNRYCTGGVRCESASAYLRSKGPGFSNVFQVRGKKPCRAGALKASSFTLHVSHRHEIKSVMSSVLTMKFSVTTSYTTSL